MQTLEFRAMNTTVLLALDGQGSSDEGLRDTEAFVEECERRFSRFLPDSELSGLNRSAGDWHEVTDELLDLLMLSRAYYDETGGLFDPSVLPDLKRSGYDVSMDELRSRGDAEAHLEGRPARPPFSAFELDVAERRVRLQEGMEIDLGGIAKGWIVQRAALRLKDYGTAAAADAGGDIYFAGTPADGSPWRIELEDPRDPSRTLASLQLHEGAVVTSSIAKRAWTQHGMARHHIIDPRTGEPASADWLSVTVIADSAHLAEAYAKALLIGGRADVPRLLLQRPQIAAIAIDPSGQIVASQNSRQYIKEYPDDRTQLVQPK